MNKDDEALLARSLTGDLGAASRRALEARLEKDPELRRVRDELERSWNALDLPETSVPPELAAQVLGRVRDAAKGEVRWGSAPFWAKAGSAASLAVGLAAGVLLAGSEPVTWKPGDGEAAELLMESPEPTLADAYLYALEQGEGLGAADDPTGEEGS